jgi:hypothetical protein
MDLATVIVLRLKWVVAEVKVVAKVMDVAEVVL